jgi:hypothetical protein
MSKFEEGLKDHADTQVSIKIGRLALYRILDSARDGAFEDVANLCFENNHIPECESILDEIEDDWQEHIAHQAFLKQEADRQNGVNLD